MKTNRLTVGQALARFLANQYIERDGKKRKFFGACLGIFGHGNVAGFGQAIAESPKLLPFILGKNEQAMVHTAIGYAWMNNRLSTLVCTSSIGPGATNMVTGAALATINRIPVLLLPGDIFASHAPDPVLQQLEVEYAGDISVNDCFRPVSKYWDRIYRPEQLVSSMLTAMRVLTSQAHTGAVTIALPQDVQAEAFDFPEEFTEERVWHIPRYVPPLEMLNRAANMIRQCKRPLIVCGGGTKYSEACDILAQFASQAGIPVAETHAGKGCLNFDHPYNVGAIGASGGLAANILARNADLVIGIGTRWTDFTTASKTLFQNPDVSFININVAEMDSTKMGALTLLGDARATIENLSERIKDFTTDSNYKATIAQLRDQWMNEIHKWSKKDANGRLTQASVIATINEIAGDDGVIVNAAGSAPGEIHKLWLSRDSHSCNIEYGYSCMGYEIAGGLGIKMAAPEREVYVLIGDGSFLMLPQEIVTSIQENLKLIIVLVDNGGFASIGSLSRSIGAAGFGTRYVKKKAHHPGDDSGDYEPLPLDLGLCAKGMGANVLRATNLDELKTALLNAKDASTTTLIHVPVDRYTLMPDYESWWDVPIAETSTIDAVNKSRKDYIQRKQTRRWYI